MTQQPDTVSSSVLSLMSCAPEVSHCPSGACRLPFVKKIHDLHPPCLSSGDTRSGWLREHEAWVLRRASFGFKALLSLSQNS